MATYKVIQDIEAEDKFVGPLTLKQFMFAAIGVIFSYLCFIVAAKGAWFVAIFFAPVAFFGFFMAIPWSKDQPTDLWVLAKIRFRFKPKKRIWDQAGKQELVSITVPKTPEKVLTKDLSETEVENRLKVLADTMNTRGWAVKHAELPDTTSNRLIPIAIQTGSAESSDSATPDIMESTQVDELIDESEKTRKAHLQDTIEQARKGTEPQNESQTVTPVNEDLQLLSENLKQKKESAKLSTGNMQKLQPKSPKAADKPKPKSKKAPKKPSQKTESGETISEVTQPPRPDIISLAHNNDLNVATLARQAKNDDDSQEVVVSLH